MPLSPFELAYQAVQSFSDLTSTESDPMDVVHENSFSSSSSIITSTLDTFPKVFYTDKNISEFLSRDDLPWDDLHRRSSFLPELQNLKIIFHQFSLLIMSKNPKIQYPVRIQPLK